MASRKRKSPEASTARHQGLKKAEGKSVRDGKDHASKKLKTSHQLTSQHGPKVAKAPKVEEAKKEPLSDKASVLREEEPLFPRGGGSVLTPLEHRQINIEAKRDVLFEQAGKSKARIDIEGGDDDQVVEQTTSVSKHRGKTQEAIKGRLVPKPAHRDAGPRIESLSFNRIVPGSLVLGQVSQITLGDVALALPNNLTGYVPLTAISDQLNERIELLAARESSKNKRGASPEVEEAIRLDNLFEVGRYLRASVTSVGRRPSADRPTRGKRRIELSVHPRMANWRLTKSDLVRNIVVQASIVSVEDHGLVMDVALEKESAKGFIPSAELDSDLDPNKLEPGTVLLCLVVGQSSAAGRVVQLSTKLQEYGKGKKTKVLSDAPTIDAFLPGTAVEMLLGEATTVGISGTLMDQVDATADLFHCGFTAHGKGIEKTFKPRQKFAGRVIFNLPGSETKNVGLSLLEHVRSLAPLKVDVQGHRKPPLDVLPISTIVEAATVATVASTVGLWLDVGTGNILAFVHISMVADERIENLFETSGPFRLGSKHRLRITGYNPVDGVYIATMKDSVLGQRYLRLEDVKVGERVKGKVDKLLTNKTGVSALIVNLGGGVAGLVPAIQMSDVNLSHPEKKFKEGMSVTARVLSINLEQHRLRLTLKKSLVRSDLPTLSSYADVVPAAQYLGMLAHVVDTGAYMQFYGNVRGFLPIKEMSEAYVGDPRKHFHTGQVLSVRVVSVDVEKPKMVVSCREIPLSDSETVEPNGKSSGETKQSEKARRKKEEQKLITAGFDWTTDALDVSDDEDFSDVGEPLDADSEEKKKKRKKRRRAEIKIDRTAELDAHGPQSAADFERLLLGEPDSSYLWLRYMAYQLQLGEVDKAREVAERALAMISISEETEKMNLWIGLLNLENTYGTRDSVDEVFKRACQFNDVQEIHERLISIYIQSEKLDQADALFQSVIKRFSQSPALWINYATFLMSTVNAPDRARSLLARATQSLPTHAHLEMTTKFAQLEFRSVNGNAERGRTFFEGLFATWPKRLDLWNVLIDLEIKAGQMDRVRALFDRVTTMGLKPKKAKWFFKRWLEFEEDLWKASSTAVGGGEVEDEHEYEKRVQNVKARAAMYVAVAGERKS